MSNRAYKVLLNDVLVGYLSEENNGRISFRMVDSYRRMPQRPVLGQRFEDDLYKVYRGRSNELPAFFANLTPEGRLRELIESSLSIAHSDELALLEAVRHDLPGAVIITTTDEELNELFENGDDEPTPYTPDSEGDQLGLHFSLAGVQLKFSLLRELDRLTMPSHGRGGEWIVKLDSSRFPNLVENEYATLEWARAAGFDVPECHIQAATSLDAPLRKYAPPRTNVFIIRRYDRNNSKRIHQEDFAQVVGQPPRLKYDHITYEGCAALVLRIAGDNEYYEFIRRLVFVIACGNDDAHLKNWSFIYPDGINAKLSPLYDQVCTLAWPGTSRELSLKLAGVKPFLRVDEAAFKRLAERANANVDKTISTVRETLERVALAWRELNARDVMPISHIEALQAYWRRAPLLKALG